VEDFVTKRIARCALAALALFVSLSLFSACGHHRSRDSEESNSAAADSTARSAESDSTKQEDEAIPVEVGVLQKGPMEAVIKSSTNIEAESHIQVVSEAARRVRQLLAEEGDHVKKGQVLLRLQDDNQRSDVDKAKSQLEHSRDELSRQEELQKKGLTTDQALKDARYTFEQNHLAYEDAMRQLGYTEVRAPIAGTITKRLVSLGDNVTVGQPLFEIIDFESMVARVYIPENDLPRLALGQTARVHAPAARKEAYHGVVSRISPVVDAKSGTVKVTIALGEQPGLRPGLFVDLELITAVDQNALRMPKRSLVYDNDEIFAYRMVADRKVEKLRVVPGLTGQDYLQPLTNFAEGDTIVVTGQAALKDGAKVRVVNSDAVTAEATQQ
jgi:membrane fusion protein (multidrug efflux system)